MPTPISGVGSLQAGSGPQRVDGQDPLEWRRRELGITSGPSFADTLTSALNEVSALQDNARDVVGAFVRGEHVEMHEVMAATEEAGIALELLIEIRNKLTDAYRAVINMQS